jgi:hypothetical protein
LIIEVERGVSINPRVRPAPLFFILILEKSARGARESMVLRFDIEKVLKCSCIGYYLAS